MQVLARQVHRSGHQVVQIICRNPSVIQEFAIELGISSVIDFDKPKVKADLYIIALSDGALPGLHKIFSVSNGIVVHTAGAVPLGV